MFSTSDRPPDDDILDDLRGALLSDSVFRGGDRGGELTGLSHIMLFFRLKDVG